VLEELADAVVSEFGERVLVLRHDVDNVYSGGSFVELAANWLLLCK